MAEKILFKLIHIYNRISLTAKVLMISAVISFVLWAIADAIQSKNLREILEVKHKERINRSAIIQRKHFDQYIQEFNQSAKLITQNIRFHEYIISLEERNWSEDKDVQVKYYNRRPSWFPDSSTMRTFIQAHYVILQDSNNRIREVFNKTIDNIPQIFLQPNSSLYLRSQGQVMLTSVDNKPYIVASINYSHSDYPFYGKLTIASHIDKEIINLALGVNSDETPVALVSATNFSIIASNRDEMLPIGTNLKTLEDRFMIIEEKFFDYGNSDLLFEVATFFLKDDIALESEIILTTERAQRFLGDITLILFFSLVIFHITRQIKKLTVDIIDFQKNLLGSAEIDFKKGDELLALKNNFLQMFGEIIKSRKSMDLIADSLRHERDNAQNYLDIAGVMLIALDTRQQITLINKRGCEILGYKESKLIGKNWFDNFTPEDSSEKERSIFRRLNEGRGQDSDFCYESRVKTNFGIRIVSWNNRILQQNDEIVGTLSSGEDITTKKMAQNQLKLQHQELQNTMQVLKDTREELLSAEKLAVIGQMSGIIAHEVLNPISTIAIRVDSNRAISIKTAKVIDKLNNTSDQLTKILKKELATAKIDDKTSKYLTLIGQICHALDQNQAERTADLDFLSHQITRVVKIIDGLSQMSKNRRHIEEVSVTRIITEVVADMEEGLKKRHINIFQEIQEVPPLRADAMDIYSIVSNLVRNAMSAIEKRTSSLDKKITIRLMPETPNTLKIIVADTGIGIAKEQWEEIFTPNFTRKGREGTGLGLSYIRKVARSYMGDVKILESEPSCGATFQVLLHNNITEVPDA